MEEMQGTRLQKAIGDINSQKAVADEFGLLLVAYEAGQHMVGIRGGENNEAVTNLFFEANRSKQMGELYDAYLKGWKDEGGDMIAMFSSIGRWSKWGSWGLMEFYDSKPEDYPKFLQTMRWAKSLGQQVKAD